MSQKKFFRLTRTCLPKHYELWFDCTSLNQVTGKVNIVIELLKSTRVIRLHAEELHIELAVLVHTDGTHKTLVAATRNNSELILRATETIKPGKYTILISFSEAIRNDLRGLYRSFDHQNNTILVTQFEPASARTAFPCFDEPQFKASFQLQLRTLPGVTALSNTSLVSKKRTKDYIEWQFALTPRMSTYLLAWCIGMFESIQTKTQNNTQIRAFAPAGKKSELRFALKVARLSLEWLERYFKIHYPLAKLDMVAIPDFAAGAMENWGLVTFREKLLLISEKSSPAQQRAVAETIAHELVHQWFGNLVTMQWWDDLWLNESFATYISYHVVAALFPKWKTWIEFRASLRSAFCLDRLPSSHPISQSIYSVEEIEAAFDSLTYQKGAAVLAMLFNTLGKQRFQKGIKNYLNRHAYDTAAAADLWQSFAAVTKAHTAAGKNLLQFMKDWTEQPGFPLQNKNTFQPVALPGLTYSRKYRTQTWHGSKQLAAENNFFFNITKLSVNTENNSKSAEDRLNLQLIHDLQAAELKIIIELEEPLTILRQVQKLTSAAALPVWQIAFSVIQNLLFLLPEHKKTAFSEAALFIFQNKLLELSASCNTSFPLNSQSMHVLAQHKKGEVFAQLLNFIHVLEHILFFTTEHNYSIENKITFTLSGSDPLLKIPAIFQSSALMQLLHDKPEKIRYILNLYKKSTNEVQLRILTALALSALPATVSALWQWVISDQVRLQDKMFFFTSVWANNRTQSEILQLWNRDYNTLKTIYSGQKRMFYLSLKNIQHAVSYSETSAWQHIMQKISKNSSSDPQLKIIMNEIIWRNAWRQTFKPEKVRNY